MVASDISRHSYYGEADIPRHQPQVVASAAAGSVSFRHIVHEDLSSTYSGTYVRDSPPVQDSQQNRAKSEMQLPTSPLPFTASFMQYSRSVSREAVSAGMTRSSSQQLQDLMLELTDQCHKLNIANARIARLENLNSVLTDQRTTNRKVHDQELDALRADMKQMKLEQDRRQAAAVKQNKILKEEVERLKLEKEAVLQREKAKHLEEHSELTQHVRKLSEKHYDTVEQLDSALEAVLNDERVKEEFKKKVKELKKEVEEGITQKCHN